MENNKKIGIGVGVMLLKEGKILLGKRHDDPEKADSALKGEGTWTVPGGKLDFGESFEEGAKREVFEETGIRVEKENLKFISVSNDRVEAAHFATIGFLCEKFEGKPEIKEPDEITEWKWFPLGELPSPMFFPVRKLLDNYLNGRVYDREL